ncbi:MAG: hypothetical protein AAGF24_03270, partial [Cyanobacteria bacterium P01_H01_bin.121]
MNVVTEKDRMTAYVNLRVLGKAKKLAKLKGFSLSSFVDHLLSEAVNRSEEKHDSNTYSKIH